MSQRLIEIVDRFGSVKVAVVGDFLLDEYVFGEISRVSREAPVLILSYRESQYAPGGGANTVAGVDALGAEAVPIGCIGADPDGDRLLSLWSSRVPIDGVERVADRQTTRKSRILAGSAHSFRQQVVRLDYENPAPLASQPRDRLVDNLSRTAREADAIIISDYSLGTIDETVRSQAIKLGRELGKPVVVDSRFHPARFPGATAVTPNISEVEHALGRKVKTSELAQLGEELRRRWRLDTLLITRGKQGMMLFEPGSVVQIPIYGTDQVVDVTGAGDTVISTFTTALAAGASFEEAARLANCAGGIVVTKRGTATVTREELRRAAAEID